MQISTLEFTKPILIIDDFLPEDAAEAVLQECIDLKPIYQPAKVQNAKGENVQLPQYRENDVVYLDDVYRGNEQNSKINFHMCNNGQMPFTEPPKHGIWCPEARAIWSKGSSIFDVVNLSTRREVIVSRYGNCDFYGLHTDPNDNPANRLVTIVYYVNKRPEKFDGGDITFKDKDVEATAHPKHNRAVVFQSNILHEVKRVRLEGDEFQNGRFSLNIWLGFQA